MTTLADRIRAALDETERVAQAADVKQGDPEWWVSEVAGTGGRHYTVRSHVDNRPIARLERLDGDDDQPAAVLDAAAVGNHIALHDPERVLRMVAAHREILDLWDDNERRRAENSATFRRLMNKPLDDGEVVRDLPLVKAHSSKLDGRREALHAVLEAIAAGLGVEEES